MQVTNTESETGTFKAYASIRIKGAIIDHLRKSSNLCRTTTHDVNKNRRKIIDKSGRLPTENELSEHL